jgi:ribonuclease D
VSTDAQFLDFGRDGVEALLVQIDDAPRLALDTESDPFHRYYEKVCLLQISIDGQRDFFFDPLEHGMPDRLRAILTDPERTVVMHGADYDVRALKQSFDLPLARLIDTAVAAQFLGMPNTGLKSLLEEILGIEISKGEQRSDWGARPLTEKQLKYARQDTQHLLALWDAMLERIEALGRRPWLEEECASMLEREPSEKAFDPDGWRKIKGAKDLNKRGKKALRALYLWREELAKKADVPPFRVVRSDGLVQLSKIVDASGSAGVRRLKRISYVPKWIDRGALLAAIEAGLGGPTPDAKPARRAGKPGIPHTPESKARLENLRKGRAKWAVELGMDPGFLIPGALLETIAKSPPQDDAQLVEIVGMSRWRREALGTRILAALAV